MAYSIGEFARLSGITATTLRAWQTLQQAMLQKLQEGKIESLRQMIYDAGREYPRPELVTNVLRPLRSQISANVAAAMTLREILDGILIAYTSFCLEADKKAPGDNILISGWHLNDPCEIWLEALTRTGQGHRIDILPVPPAALAPEIFPDRKWLLVTSGKLTAARKKQVAQWQQQTSRKVEYFFAQRVLTFSCHRQLNRKTR